MADWQKVITEHGPAVWQSAYRLLGNHADASDCFQETFVSAIEVSQRQKVRNLPALLSRLVTARAIDQLRLRFRKEKHNNEVSRRFTESKANPEPLHNLQQRELAHKLREALAKLPRQEAQVFCLRYLDDMSYQQIAEQIGIRANAAGVMLHRAKAKLQKSLFFLEKEQKNEVVL